MGLDRAFDKRHNEVMAVTETAREKNRVSQVVKVTGMSEELLRLLDTRVQQQATGRGGTRHVGASARLPSKVCWQNTMRW